MTEALPWILVGLAGGIAVEWIRHRPILAALSQLPKDQVDVERQARELESLKSQIADLQNQTLSLPKLRSDLADAQTRLTQLSFSPNSAASHASPMQAESETITEAPESKTENLPDDLTQLPGITPGYAENLAASPFNSFAAIAAASPDQLSTAAKAQPWDNLDPQAWINHAQNHSSPQATAPISKVEASIPTETPIQKMPWDPD